jgi:hypothetical protein
LAQKTLSQALPKLEKEIVVKETGLQNINLNQNLPGLTCGVLRLVEDHTFIFDLEPFHGIILCDPVLDPNTRLAPATTANTVTRALQHNKEVHPINTGGRIIPET